MNPLADLIGTIVWTLAEFYHTFGVFGIILLVISLPLGIWSLVKIARKMAR